MRRLHVPTLGPARSQTLGEEIANAVSHGLGFLLAVAALPVLVVAALHQGTVLDVVAACVFAGTMIVQYLVSALYHAVPASRAKAWLNRIDHAAIFLFIAGTYTPFALGVLRDGAGGALLALVWAAALVGVVGKLLNRLRHPLWSTGLYVAMGWAGLVVLEPLAARMGGGGLAWLLGGGLAYTVGAVIFLLDHRVRYGHFVWHLCVLGGSACHFCAALWHAVPGPVLA